MSKKTNPELQELTDGQLASQIKKLQDELTRREAEKKQAEVKRLSDLGDTVLLNIDTLLLFATHDRTSCSDADPCNRPENCPRCTLLKAKQENYWEYTQELEIVVERRDDLFEECY